MTIDFIIGDSLETMRTLPDQSVDLIACSPPFLALRNYNDLDGQWGTEPDPAGFLDNLLTLTVEMGRVLTEHGSIAIELGDTYSGSGGHGGDYNEDGIRSGQTKFAGSAKASSRRDRATIPTQNPGGAGWPLAKSLCGIPTLYAWSLAYGRNLLNPEHTSEPWRIRNIISWTRNNPPVGALGDKVRPATSYITVATRSKKRWFDLDAVRTPHTEPDHIQRNHMIGNKSRGDRETNEFMVQNPNGSPPLDHWHDEHDGDVEWFINGQGSKLAHFAMWPPKLAERIVLSMCPQGVCTGCGEPRRRLTEITPDGTPTSGARYRDRQVRGATGERHGGTTVEHLGWSACDCEDPYRRGVVCDPFCGTGTTLAVADIHRRDAIGIDLDPANEHLYSARYDEVKKSLFGVSPQTPGQMALI